MNLHEMKSSVRLNEMVVQKIFFVLLLLLSLAIAAKIMGGLLQKHLVARRVSETIAFLKTQNEKGKEYLDEYAKEVDKLNEKGAFVPEKPKPSPPKVTGILGNSVLMNNKWCKVGDEHAGAKILKIEPTQITILWEGKEKKLAPLLASNPGNMDNKPKVVKKIKPLPDGGPQKLETEPAVAQQPEENDPLAWLGMEVSAELRAFLLKLFDMMPAEQLEKAKQEWANLSDDQKKQKLDEAQQMVDSGQADIMLQQMEARQG